MGHPLGDPELVQESLSLQDTIAALQERKLIVEGEVGLEVTNAGRTLRSAIRFRPRESLLSKLLARISISIGLKDLFG